MRQARLILGVMLLASTALAQTGVAPSGLVAPGGPPAPAPGAARLPRLPGFAPRLADAAPILGPAGWQPGTQDEAWHELARSTRANRQAVRWRLARGLIARDSGAEALGVFEVMRQDDPDLNLVPAWHLAHGVALELLGRDGEAIEALSQPALSENSEACAWQMRALARAGLSQAALGRITCALPAINARGARQRRPFLLAAIAAATASGRSDLAVQWLAPLADRDPAANLYRGKVALAQGQGKEGTLRLERVMLTGSPEQRADAEIAIVQHSIGAGKIATPAALAKLQRLRFSWRGGAVEEQALRLEAKLAADSGDLRGSLTAGATLFRYFAPGPAAGPMLAGLQRQLAQGLGPDSAMPLPQAAGLYWDFRDLAPLGAEGDLLVSQLAARLQSAGLYGRAAQLLDYQLTARTKDVAQGPLSARVASLYILAGHPDQALATLRNTDQTPYPPEMLAERHRVQAAALEQLGRTAEALAVLQDVPNNPWLRAEMSWRERDWAGLTATIEPRLPQPGRLSDISQTIILRHAIGLAMLGRGDALARLHTRYSSSFSGLPTQASFAVLTSPIDSIDAAAISRAMAALPTGSPAGPFADLLDARVRRTRPAGE